MHDAHELAVAAAGGEGGDDLAQRVSYLGKWRMRAKLEIRRELKRKQEIRTRGGLQPGLLGNNATPGEQQLRPRADPAGMLAWQPN